MSYTKTGAWDAANGTLVWPVKSIHLDVLTQTTYKKAWSTLISVREDQEGHKFNMNEFEILDWATTRHVRESFETLVLLIPVSQ